MAQSPHSLDNHPADNRTVLEPSTLTSGLDASGARSTAIDDRHRALGHRALGHHALLDLYGCDDAILNDKAQLHQMFHDTAIALGCTIVDESFHQFSPQGVSGVVVLAESHLSLHTWPEHGYAAVDLYTCGDPAALDQMPVILKEKLKAERIDFKRVARGFVPAVHDKAAG